MGTVAVLLAAGAGRRMGTPKALLHHPDGVPWVVRAAGVLTDGGCGEVLVVVGARGEEVAAVLPAGAVAVPAADWQEGMGASLHAGLLAAAERQPGADAALVGLVDTPGVTVDVVARLLAHTAPDVLARAAYDGTPAHPVLLGRWHWEAVAASARGDAGARAYLAEHAAQVLLVECADVGSGEDVDHPARTLLGVSDQVGDHPALAPGHADAPRDRDTSRVREPARRVVLTAVTDEPLDVAAHEAAVADRGAGAVVTFSGVVRDHDHGLAVDFIEYVGHPSAAQVLADVAADVVARADVEALAVSHRLGRLDVGDAALVVAVSGVHRQEAFAAAALLVDEAKHRLPVWKRQVFPDGTDEWVACP